MVGTDESTELYGCSMYDLANNICFMKSGTFIAKG